jgi:hypothetical protein
MIGELPVRMAGIAAACIDDGLSKPLSIASLYHVIDSCIYSKDVLAIETTERIVAEGYLNIIIS